MKLSHLIVPFCFLLLSACGFQQDENSAAKLPSPDSVQEWYPYSVDFFLDNKATDSLSLFADRLDSFITPVADQQSDLYLDKSVGIEFKALLPEPDANEDMASQVAVLERQIRFAKMLLTHQMTFYGELFVSEQDLITIRSVREFAPFTDSLLELAGSYPVITSGSLDVYEADDQSGLLAYQRRDGNARAYIAFNFSFDQHELPLPLGFMASTKVTFWQSDSPSVRTFVTSAPLTIQPMSAAIVIVN